MIGMTARRAVLKTSPACGETYGRVAQVNRTVAPCYVDSRDFDTTLYAQHRSSI